MSTVQLGILRPVTLREVWAHEAQDFTPWLVENLVRVGDLLGMDLEFIAREAPVGRYSLDILAKETGTNRTVIIENQITCTDHDHLGKLLTYAGGHEASIVVWVAESFTDEHRQAINWLNEHTDEATEFFCVGIEVLQIDDSRPAANFKLVVTPNEWQKSRKNVVSVQASEKHERYRHWFQGLIDELRDKHRFTRARQGQPQNWYSFSSGTAGLQYSTFYKADGRLAAEIYIDTGNKEQNKAIFDAAFADRTKYEAEMGLPLSWERLDNRQASRIAVYRPGSISDPDESLIAHRRWVIENLLALKRIFGPRLDDLSATTAKA